MALARNGCAILYCVFIIVASLFLELCVGQEEVLRYNLTEQSPVGTFVGDVRGDSKLRSTASEEEFLQITYSILTKGEEYEALFTVDSQNGSLFTADVIDREALSACAYQATCTLSLSVVARAKVSSFYRTLEVAVTLLDINDHAPAFPRELTTLDISELATVGSSMSLVGAVDADSGQNSLQRYYILNEANLNLPFTTSYEMFVDGSSVVKLQITGDLDRETREAYSVIVVAEDGGNPKLTGTMTVYINIEDTNDNAPRFTHLTYNVTVNETIPAGTEILTLSASDADLGVNSEITYRLSKNQIGKIHEQFAVNESTGAVSVKERFVSGGEYRIIVEASDNGVQPLMTQAVLLVTVIDSDNNQPIINVDVFSDTNIGSVSEYANVGTVVAHIRITDTDTGVNGIIECEIDSDEQVFKLQAYDVNEFKVTVAKEIDRETIDYIYVIINCHDRGTPPKNTFAEFTVQVIDENDHAPSFLQEIYFVDVPESNQLNHDIVQVAATDGDTGNNGAVMYSMWAPGPYRFSMDPMSGIIKALSVFDRETDDKVLLYAYASDNGVPRRTSTATIQINVLDLNDNDPEFTKPIYVLYIEENLPADTSVGFVEASDSDIGLNADIGFHLDPAIPFRVDTSGVIRTKDPLNREDTHAFSFIVTAFDHGIPARNTSCNVVVHVTDVNDHSPRFIFPDADNYTVELEADSLISTLVTTVEATDLDEGLNGQVVYSILNTNATDLFTIDSVTGEITLNRPVVETDRQLYNLRLLVKDRGTPEMYATTSLNVFIARRHLASPVSEGKGQNLLIAITLGSVTFVLVFTIILVICILKRRWLASAKDNADSEDQFCQKVKVSDRRRVKFADLEEEAKDSSTLKDEQTGNEPMTTFSSDGNDSRDSDMTSSTVDMETPILDRQKRNLAEKVSTGVRRDSLPRISETQEMHHSTPRSEISTPRSGDLKPRYENSPRYENLPRSENQRHAPQPHTSLLNPALKPPTCPSAFSHDDNHSQTSSETVTSDSGRGGSESDIHSASLSQSHDYDIRPPTDVRYLHEPVNSTFAEHPAKPWLNLADLRYHNCHKVPVAQQLHDDRKHRLQLRNLADRKNARPSAVNLRPNSSILSHSDRNLRKVLTPKQTTIFPAPPSDLDRSFMTYEDDDDDLSTTTSGSYTIDQDETSLDFRSPIHKTPGLKSCLV